MARTSVLLVVTLLLALALASVPPAAATHEWGHRYMIFGRILDTDGEPAENLPINVTVQTSKAVDPRMPIATDCQGLYYTLRQGFSAQEEEAYGMEGGVMHIHNSQLGNSYTIETPFGKFSADTKKDLKRSTHNIQLDSDYPEKAECDQAEDWTTSYIVSGHVQIKESGGRTDVMPSTYPGGRASVKVTLETPDGPKTWEEETNNYGDYFAIFQDVANVEDGAKITVQWDTYKRTGEVNTKYRVTGVDVVVDKSFWAGTMGKVIIGTVAVGLVAGLVAWVAVTVKDRMAAQKAIAGSSRKRANR